ncbi:probable N-acetyltransferase camello [Hyperolius riggenbachi]|uniref:probable N-acetyltransferase camello n=1 Tax=Hyperolius riggenbachi TaxID=752182 RepID=UPI0035A2A873
MSTFSIREYKNSDYHVVRDLFAQGMMDYIPSLTMYMLKLPQVYGTILASLITSQLLFRSYFFSMLVFGSLLLACPCGLIYSFRVYVKNCLKKDLLNIEESYMEKPNSCFWVTESGGRIVGMVGAQPSPSSRSEMVMRRLSVAKDHQGRGMAKALCMLVIDFARQRGYRQISLDTSNLQAPACKLYQRLGFRTTNIIPVNTLYGRFVNMTVEYYSYDV